MKSEWKQDFNQDLLVRWTEPTKIRNAVMKSRKMTKRLLSAQSRIRRTRRLIVCQRLEGKKVGETNSFSLDTKRSTKKASLTATWVLLQTLNIQLLMSTLP